MLRLPRFDYLAPHTLDEAVAMLAAHQEEAMLVAGGTDVYPGMKRRLFTPHTLIGLHRLTTLKHLDVNDGLTLGSGLTLAQLAAHPLIVRDYAALAMAASVVSTPQLRHMGTLGGNLCLDTRCTYYNQTEPWRQALGYCLKKDGEVCWVAPGSTRCWAVHASDLAPVLIALGASVRLVGPVGERWVPVQALYHNDGIHYLSKSPSEILTDIHLPVANGLRMTYKKLRRRGAFDFPVLSMAIALRQEEDGTCTAAHIVLGAVGSSPMQATEAEAVLIGAKINHAVIAAAAQQAFQTAKPLDNTDMGYAYRKQMVRVYVARALHEVSQVHGETGRESNEYS